MKFFNKGLFFFRGYNQALFFICLVLYVLVLPPSDLFEGTWMDTLVDALGIGSLMLGGFLRIWAVSHVGKCTRSRRLKARFLVTTGPYVYIRHPIYVGNFFIGSGMVILSEAFILLPVFLVLFTFQYRSIVAAEEEFLAAKFEGEFTRYAQLVPKYMPRTVLSGLRLSFGRNFPLKELGTTWGVVVGGIFFEWIESPVHRHWILVLYHWLTGRMTL